jgi:hypothetical protein
MYIFVNELPNDPEAIFIFEPKNYGSTLKIASNCEYEIWSNNMFIGFGGRRCPNEEAYLNEWTYPNIKIRLHWLNPKLTSVWYREVFVKPFIYYEGAPIFTAYIERGITFASPACNQLARQNIINKTIITQVQIKQVDIYWNIIKDPVHLMNHILVKPSLKNNILVKRNQTFKKINKFDDDIVKYVQSGPLYKYITLDLGYIALHKFSNLVPGYYLYTQTADLQAEWSSSNQKKVRLADSVSLVAKNQVNSPIGYRGCRYVHIFYDNEIDISGIQVWRAEYPFTWKILPKEKEDNSIIIACKNTMIACVDGGFTDCCWRERAQWTGDARMMAKAVTTLTDNNELVPFVLGQIAKSYDKKIGMINGCYPINKQLIMPPYHLAFCLAVYENSVLSLIPLVKESIQVWKTKYIKNGLVSGQPGWDFIDWNFSDQDTVGRGITGGMPNCVINVWFRELCDYAFGNHIGYIDDVTFDKVFKCLDGYCLIPGGKMNYHATILAGTINTIIPKNIVTPYFGYFVAKSIKNKRARELFINSIYLASANRYGTIWEKHDNRASLAHGWSVAIAELLINE